MHRNLSRLVLAVWLSAAGSPVLAVPMPRAAAPHEAGSVQRRSPSSSPFGGLWQRLTHLQAAIGCTLDPNGAKCASSPAGTPATAVTATAVDNGCSLDPNG